MIRYESDEPNPYVAPTVDLQSPVSPMMIPRDTKSKRDINSIKLAMPENSMIKSKNVTMNVQQRDFSQDILAEEIKGIRFQKGDAYP